jgi:transitional endoplasmic reticulum ATPase
MNPSEPKKDKDYSTAILDSKKAPNKLMVDDATNDDNSAICMS